MAQEFTVVKKINDLNLKEEVSEVYCYMDFNKQTIELYYNDEIKLPINIIRLVQKQFPKNKLPTKKVFAMVKDVKLVFDKVKSPDDILINVEMSI